MLFCYTFHKSVERCLSIVTRESAGFQCGSYSIILCLVFCFVISYEQMYFPVVYYQCTMYRCYVQCIGVMYNVSVLCTMVLFTMYRCYIQCIGVIYNVSAICTMYRCYVQWCYVQCSNQTIGQVRYLSPKGKHFPGGSTLIAHTASN